MTARIDSLISAIDGFDPALVAALDADDIADALGRVLDPANPDRRRALAILALGDPSAGGALASAVGQLVVTPGLDESMLVAAIAAAAAIGPDAVPLVEPAVASPDPFVALAAWRTLQQIALSGSLPALTQLAPAPGSLVGDHAAFALSVIAYRAGTSGFELGDPEETEFLGVERDEDVAPIQQSAVADADFDLFTRLPGGDRYLVAPDKDRTTTIDCGQDHMLLVIDPDVHDAIPQSLLQAPALAGLVALRDPLREGYSVRYLILTWPDEQGGVHLALHRPDGTQVYYGHAKSEAIDDQQANFLLFFALNRPGVERVALTIVASSSAVALTGDLVAATATSGDRLEPEPA